MESNTTPRPQYAQVTVDVPEDRLAEFHAFFASFLAGPTGRGRRGAHRRHARGHHGRGCARGRERVERPESSTEPTEI